MKRVFDLIFSSIGLLLLLPIFIIVAILIKINSKGPVFFKHERIGKDFVPFKIIKFRTMISNDQEESLNITVSGDKRVTTAGKILRKYKIDEFAQLINVLKGDMSFVGPRPERPFFVESFKEQIPLYINRLLIKPGVTGWAQVRWHYDENIEDVKEKLKYDLYYINNHSLWLDIKIFFLTLVTVLTQKGQ